MACDVSPVAMFVFDVVQNDSTSLSVKIVVSLFSITWSGRVTLDWTLPWLDLPLVSQLLKPTNPTNRIIEFRKKEKDKCNQSSIWWFWRYLFLVWGTVKWDNIRIQSHSSSLNDKSFGDMGLNWYFDMFKKSPSPSSLFDRCVQEVEGELDKQRLQLDQVSNASQRLQVSLLTFPIIINICIFTSLTFPSS